MSSLRKKYVSLQETLFSISLALFLLLSACTFCSSHAFPLDFSAVDQKNPLLQLKQSGIGVVIGRVKRRYKRKNATSPVKKGPSPLKRRHVANSPGKMLPPSIKSRETMNILRVSR